MEEEYVCQRSRFHCVWPLAHGVVTEIVKRSPLSSSPLCPTPSTDLEGRGRRPARRRRGGGARLGGRGRASLAAGTADGCGTLPPGTRSSQGPGERLWRPPASVCPAPLSPGEDARLGQVHRGQGEQHGGEPEPGGDPRQGAQSSSEPLQKQTAPQVRLGGSMPRPLPSPSPL